MLHIPSLLSQQENESTISVSIFSLSFRLQQFDGYIEQHNHHYSLHHGMHGSKEIVKILYKCS